MRPFQLGVSAIMILALALIGAAATRAETGTLAHYEPPMLPEGLAVGPDGTAYVGIATKGEIHRVTPDGGRSTLATLKPGLGSLLGLAVDGQGHVLAALASSNTPGSDRHGIWRVRPDGSKELLAALPPVTMPNGLALAQDGTVYVSESARGAIWRIHPDGSAESWLKDELLDGDLEACPPRALMSPTGPNGLVIDRSGSLLVANTTRAQIVRVPVQADGSPGTLTVAYGPDCSTLAGADGMALDADGSLYVTLNWQDRVIRIDPSGSTQVLASKSDGLDFPASIAIGRDGLLVTNYALLSYLHDASPRPALLRLDRR